MFLLLIGILKYDSNFYYDISQKDIVLEEIYNT
jgi:hypothetical protein